MIDLSFLQDKTIGVVGLASSGAATLDALVAAGANVIAWDDNLSTRTSVSDGRRAHVSVEPPEQWRWDVVDMLVLSPGIPLTHPQPHAVVKLAQQYNVDIVGDVELLYRACPNATYIAITGTNGKSTTTALIGHIIKQAGISVQVGGNIGTPALALDMSGDGEIIVLELSSYQLDLVRSTQFDVSLLLNLSEDHLDRHGDMDGYIVAKKHIFDRQQKEGVAIVGVDDAASEAVCREMVTQQNQHVIPIMTTQTSDEGVYVKEGVLHQKWDDDVIELGDMIALQGVHNHQNAAAAYAACRSVGLAHDKITSGMKTFPGLSHRMQVLGQWHDMTFVNDSKATNADAAAQSLATFDHIHWIVGGVAKEGGIENLQKFFSKIDHAYLIGQAQEEFAKTLGDHIAHSMCDTLENAFDEAVAKAQLSDESHSIILLAPACASFDQFKNFEARGEAFMTLYEALIASGNGGSARAV